MGESLKMANVGSILERHSARAIITDAGARMVSSILQVLHGIYIQQLVKFSLIILLNT